MNKRHRLIHLIVWMILAPALLGVIAAGVALRPERVAPSAGNIVGGQAGATP